MYPSDPTIRRLVESLLESTSDAILLCDEQFTIRHHNRSAMDSLGLTDEQLSSLSLPDIFEVDGKDVFNVPDRFFLKNVNPRPGFAQIGRRDMVLESHSIIDERLILVALFERNPVECRRTVRLVTDHAKEGLFQITSDNQLVYVNEHMRKMFGYASTREMLTLGAGDLFAKEHANAVFQQNTLQQKVIEDLRILLKRKDSSTFWGQLSWIPDHSHDGRIIFGRIRDITDLITYEALLSEKAKLLARTTEQLDTFLYHASHDLRAPITTIQGIINLRKLEQGTDDPYIEMIKDCLDTLTTIVRQLTALSRNNNQRVSGKAVNFDLILEGVFAELQTHKNYECIEQIRELDQEHPFFSDDYRIGLILKNVIKNAYDYRDRKKASPLISVSVTTSKERAVIEIFDNGCGIPKAHLSKVFDIFYRASTDSPGSGIGLYVAREAVKMLSGRISMRSVRGVGTCVTVEIPNGAGLRHPVLEVTASTSIVS